MRPNVSSLFWCRLGEKLWCFLVYAATYLTVNLCFLSFSSFRISTIEMLVLFVCLDYQLTLLNRSWCCILYKVCMKRALLIACLIKLLLRMFATLFFVILWSSKIFRKISPFVWAKVMITKQKRLEQLTNFSHQLHW